MYEKLINALKQSLSTSNPEAVLTDCVEICVLKDESVQVEFQLEGDTKEYILTFTPTAEGKYETDGKITEEAPVADEKESSEETEAKKAKVVAETKSEEEMAKKSKVEEAKAKDYSELKSMCSEMKAEMENMGKELKEIKACMVKAPEAKAEPKVEETPKVEDKEPEAKASVQVRKPVWELLANKE